MENENYNYIKYWGAILNGFTLLFLFLPACKVDSKYGGLAGSGSMYKYNGKVGSIYQFIFGSNHLGESGNEYAGFNFPMFLGFLAIIIALIHFIMVMTAEDTNNSKIDIIDDFTKYFTVQSIFSGIAMFFLSPIFTHKAVYSFYESLPSSIKSGYEGFRYGFGCVFVFLFLLVIFICNLVITIKIKKTEEI